MPHYHTLGQIPKKRHVQFRKPNGELFAEELVSTEGFSDIYSLVYHHYPPTMVKHIEEAYSVEPKAALAKNMQHRSYACFNVPPADNWLESRTILFFNNDLTVGMASPKAGTGNEFFKNAQGDEMLFIHKGSGTLKTMFGSLKFEYGDYIVIPRGVIYQIEFDTEENKIFFVESYSPLYPPRRYRNNFGQLMEDSPFCERDFRLPENLETFDQHGDFRVSIKKQDMIFPYIYATHPFDVVGWDGYYYPYIFSIHDFEPITGRVHLPPPIHQTFAAKGFVVCSFVPRLFDYHPEGIPAPYNHSNIDSDEVLYYVEGNFMSRKGIDEGFITLHPMGIPHGPHPGTVEKSIGKKETLELAVMVDTFAPLQLTQAAFDLENEGYYKSWME